jgi:hypothetical protein
MYNKSFFKEYFMPKVLALEQDLPESPNREKQIKAQIISLKQIHLKVNKSL